MVARAAEACAGSARPYASAIIWLAGLTRRPELTGILRETFGRVSLYTGFLEVPGCVG